MINLRVLSIAVSVSLGMLGAIQLASPESLGISPIAARWLGIVATGLGILAGFLPRVQGPSTDPDVIADRVLALTPAQRTALVDELEHRATEERDVERGLQPWQVEALRKHRLEDSRRPTTEIRSHGGEGERIQ